MKVSAPMVMIGAVSPIARDSADDDAGQDAAGRIRHDMIAHRLPFGGAERVGRLADGCRGMARIASRVATITIGRIRSASVRPAVRMLWPRPKV